MDSAQTSCKGVAVFYSIKRETLVFSNENLLASANVYATDEERSKAVRARGPISVGLEETDFELVSKWMRQWKMSSSASQKLEDGLLQSLQEAAQDDTLTVDWGYECDRLILNMSKLGLTGDVSGLY